jgi:hypothetical protein
MVEDEGSSFPVISYKAASMNPTISSMNFKVAAEAGRDEAKGMGLGIEKFNALRYQFTLRRPRF